LGVKDISKFNYVLLAKWKWKWRLGGEKGAWRNIIDSKWEFEGNEKVYGR